MKDNISKLNNCYGCGVCILSCPKKIIRLKENSDGFYSPVVINQDQCIECGLCLEICSFNHTQVALDCEDPIGYAGWSNNENIRLRCSSGGVGFEIGRLCIEKGMNACGVRYDADKRRAEHFVASSVEEFMPSIGSKYIQSNSQNAFLNIDKNTKYLITGTPCQIDSFRRYIRQFKIENNFLLLDFFCHGVPSLLAWDSYLNYVETKVGKSTFVSWRNKTNGWHDSWAVCADTDAESIDWHNSYNVLIKGKKHLYVSRMTEGDLFYKLFLGNYCLNKCCYKSCKYKLAQSSADVRIGDLWGKTYAEDNEGTSAVLTFTKKGEKIISELISNEQCTFEYEPLSVVMEGQMSEAPQEPWVREKILDSIRFGKPIAETVNKWCRLFEILILPKRIVRKVIRTLKK